jgi:nitrate/nitrite transporter NarK
MLRACIDSSQERETISKVTWRLILLLFLCYIIAYIDRINATTVSMVLAGRHSDRTGERRWHVAAGAFAAAVGFSASAMAGNLVLALAGLVLAFAGLKAMMGPFWAFSTAALSGTAAAGGIAWINSIGNLGGFIGPTVVGQVRAATGSYSGALFTLSGALVLLGLLALTLRAEDVRRHNAGFSNPGSDRK